MAERVVSDIKDSGQELLDKISDLEVFRRENQVCSDWSIVFK